jgi:LysM repeat protein
VPVASKTKLELTRAAFYCRIMKRISLGFLLFALASVPLLHAQDAATEERLNKLTGQIEDLIAGQKAQQKHIADLAKELESVREQASKPTGNYAGQDDLKHLAEAVKEVDRKRLDDYDKMQTAMAKLSKTLQTPTPAKKAPSTTSAEGSGGEKQAEKIASVEKGIEYTIQPGDTLSAVVQACKERKVKVTVDQILKANPGLKPEKLRAGQKIFIPAVPQS